MTKRTFARRVTSWALLTGVGIAAASWETSCATSSDLASGDLAGFEPTTGGTGASSGGPPPEREVESTYSAPVATGKYVWIANPASGRVAYIDASTLEIKLIDAGNQPSFVAAIPDPVDDVAIVLNVLSLDATVLRASGGSVSTSTLAVPSSGNAWAVSGDGRWAVAWTDAHRVPTPDPVDGYQDITVLDLTSGAMTSTELSIGYRPVTVAFDKANQHAYAVTQDGVSIVSLTKGTPAVVKNVALSDNPADMASTSDVSITPDGSYALVRRDGQTAISIFALSDGTRTDVALPALPTDLDLSTDGKTAVVVMRDASEVALLPIPGIVGTPTGFVTVTLDATVGSATLAPMSPMGFFYTNATPNAVLAVMDTSLATPVPRDILLRAPILAVFPTEDASHAVILHDALDVEGSHFPAAVSLAPIALTLPPKIVGLDAPVISVAVAPAGDHVLVAAGDDGKNTYEVLVGAMPSLKVNKIPLASLPIAAGVVAGAGRGYVAQKHPDGRITFIDFASGQVRTLTGFELGTLVTDGAP